MGKEEEGEGERKWEKERVVRGVDPKARRLRQVRRGPVRGSQRSHRPRIS